MTGGIETDITVGGTKFKVGDRVTRPENVYDRNSPIMHGTIARVYNKTTSHYPINDFVLGPYPELYDVRWDEQFRKFSADGKYEFNASSFLPHGLDREELDNFLEECDKALDEFESGGGELPAK